MIGPLVAAAILAGTGSGGFAAAGPVAAASGAHRADSDAPRASPIEWRPVIAGVTYAAIPIPRAVPLGDPHLHVVRIDPRKARLRAAMASEVDGRRRTAAEWCAGSNLAVAINLGMFQGAPLSNVGYARQGKHLDNSRWNAYRSALVFGARRSGIPPARLIDLDQPGARRQTDEYEAAVQNLRLIEAPGRNVWSRQTRRWSEAAIGMDAQGEILFLFCRSPFTMFEFNRLLLSLPLRVTRAMHVEGGPEASLSIHAGGWNLDLCGSYETGFREDDGETHAWPIPNVVGVEATPQGTHRSSE